MCKGEDHGPFDRRTMPDVAISAKVAFAAASFCSGSGRAFARTGCPRVSMVWRTACLGWSILKFGTVTVGNSANNLVNGDGLALAANASPEIRDLCLVRCRGAALSSSGCTSWWFLRSTKSELWVRKSAPMRALFTSATRKFHSYVREPTCSRNFFSP